MFQSPGRRPEAYIATVRRFGVDIGVTAQTQFTWAVNAPNTRLGYGDLAGTYGGVGANASIGIGGGGNFLVGGPRNAYALQPISVQGQTGLNVAAGIAGLELEPVGFGHRGHVASSSPSRLKEHAAATAKRPAKAGLFSLARWNPLWHREPARQAVGLRARHIFFNRSFLHASLTSFLP